MIENTQAIRAAVQRIERLSGAAAIATKIAEFAAQGTGDLQTAALALSGELFSGLIEHSGEPTLSEALAVLRAASASPAAAESAPAAEAIQITAEDGVPPETFEKLSRVIARLIPEIRRAAEDEGCAVALGALHTMLLNFGIEWAGAQAMTEMMQISVTSVAQLEERRQLAAAEPAGSA